MNCPVQLFNYYTCIVYSRSKLILKVYNPLIVVILLLHTQESCIEI